MFVIGMVYGLFLKRFGAFEVSISINFDIWLVNSVYANLSLQLYFNSLAANAGGNKAASSSTSLNTRKLDEETENLTRE